MEAYGNQVENVDDVFGDDSPYATVVKVTIVDKCVCIHVCVCMCLCIHVCMCMYVCMCVCMYTSAYVCVYMHVCLCVCVCVYVCVVCVTVCLCVMCMCIHSGRNKDQKLVSCFFEEKIFYRLLIAIPMKMYSKFGQSKWLLVSHMLKLVRK